MAPKNLDVITLGRTSVDLYGQQVGGRLEDMASFAKYLGGCPANIAIGTAKLGLRSGIITRVGQDHMGRFLQEEFARFGVNLNGISVDRDRLTALVLLGIRDRQTFPLIFYREDCADMALQCEDIDPDFVASASALLVTGTHLSTPTVFDASAFAISCAKNANRKVILDIDYRPVLWGLTSKDAGEDRFVANSEVTGRLQKIAQECDLIVGTEEEFHILGGTTETLQAIQNVRHLTGAELVLKLGPNGCVVFPASVPNNIHDGIRGPGFEVDVFNVLGAGDGFLSGYLSGWLRNLPIPECCRRANACGAIVVSRHGCAPAMPTQDELDRFLSLGKQYRQDIENGRLDHVHWATTRRSTRPSVFAFAFDHRTQMTDMAEDCGKSPEIIAQAKQLAYRAFKRVAHDDSRFGMLLDPRFAQDALSEITGTNHWIGRPIEYPGSRPLRFEGDADVGMELATWPVNQVVKCLLFYHPNDPALLCAQQDAQILRLFDACRKTGRELLLEIIASKNGPIGDTTIASVLTRMYDIGVFPDWWKLEPARTETEWKNTTRVIETRDPYCRGIVLLGLSKPCDEMVASFEAAAHFPLIKGFAVGRSIFDAPLRAWMRDEISDLDAIDQMATNFKRLVDGWQHAQGKIEHGAALQGAPQ